MSSLSTISNENREILLGTAKESIRYGVDHNRSPSIDPQVYPEQLRAVRASFVTLYLENRLRGCIGTLEAVSPLVKDVSDNAYKSAFSDPRFDPVSESEVDKLGIHLSILSPPVEMVFKSEEDLLAQLQPTIDGIILQEDGRRGTFLPSVWESLPDPSDFVKQLKRKAGLPVDYWSTRIKAFRYFTESIQ